MRLVELFFLGWLLFGMLTVAGLSRVCERAAKALDNKSEPAPNAGLNLERSPISLTSK